MGKIELENELTSILWVKVLISGIAIVLVVAQLTFGLPIQAETIALVMVAALPWLSSILESVQLPGGTKVQFKQVQARVESHQKQLDAQQRVINELVIYSMSHYIFNHLSQIYHRTRSGEEYIFRNNEPFKRDLRFLRDHGYLEHFNISPLQDGQDLISHVNVKLTPVGNFFVELREELEAQNKRALAEQLSSGS